MQAKFAMEGAAMKKYNSQSSLITAGIKSCVLSALLAGAIASCGKSADRPMPPQAPPKPQVAPMSSLQNVQKAIFTYSHSPSIHYQNGLGVEIPPLVIRT
jgi:hypothetical protein